MPLSLSPRNLDLSYDSHRRELGLYRVIKDPSMAADYARYILDSCTLPPTAIENYRHLTWASSGFNNLLAVLSRPLSLLCPSLDLSAWSLFFNLIAHYEVTLTPGQKHTILHSITNGHRSPIFFDGYMTFLSGHSAALECSLRALEAFRISVPVLLVYDRSVTLFPSLISAILSTYPNLILVDTSDLPVRLHKHSSLSSIQSLKLTTALPIPESVINKLLFFPHRNSVINPIVDVASPSSLASILPRRQGAWAYYSATSNHNKTLPAELIRLAPVTSKWKSFIVYHARSDIYKHSSSFRDGLSIAQRSTLVNTLASLDIGVIVFGVTPPNGRIASPYVVYIDEFGHQVDHFQLDILTHSIALVGSVSGATNLTLSTCTPLLYIDVYLPYALLAPSHVKIIMRRPTSLPCGPFVHKYYEHPFASYPIADTDPHPLGSLAPVTDLQILHGLQELIGMPLIESSLPCFDSVTRAEDILRIGSMISSKSLTENYLNPELLCSCNWLLPY